MKYQLLQCILKEKIMGFKEPARNGEKYEKKNAPKMQYYIWKVTACEIRGGGGSEKEKEKTLVLKR